MLVDCSALFRLRCMKLVPMTDQRSNSLAALLASCMVV
jgi:hypothetical protein